MRYVDNSEIKLVSYKNDTYIDIFFLSQSSMVSRTMYTIAWYELPISFKTEICLLMLRSQKSSKITAGKFYIMHLENFSTVRRNYHIFRKMYENSTCKQKNILLLFLIYRY